MKVLLAVVLFINLLQVSAYDNGTMFEVGSPDWIICHGMPRSVFKSTCACMLKLKKLKAMKYGHDPMQVDHWVVAGDRIYSQADCIAELTTMQKGRKKRKFYIQSNFKWEFPVLYTFQNTVPYDDRKMIEAAISHWQNFTCLRFEHYDANIHDNKKQRIHFTNHDSGCFAYVGMQTNLKQIFPQQVNLETSGCTGWIGVAIHEIGHTLGLFHEQNRLDRDFWVTFHADHVRPNVLGNFDLEIFSDNFGVPYDYGSVMQYDKMAFSLRGDVVLEPIMRNQEYTMGQRGTTSFMDVKVMNTAYCGAVCLHSMSLPCKHGGYVDPTDCTRCRCPEGLGGTLCNSAGSGHPDCNPTDPILDVTEQVHCVMSPGYESDTKTYPIGSKCNWILRAPPGEQVRARFDSDFGIYCSTFSNRGPMCFHWLEVKTKADKEVRGGRTCCYDNSPLFWNNPGVMVSENNEMVIHFDGTYPQFANKYTTIPSEQSRRGFKLCYALNVQVENDESETPRSKIANAKQQFWQTDFIKQASFSAGSAPPSTTGADICANTLLRYTSSIPLLVAVTVVVFFSDYH